MKLSFVLLFCFACLLSVEVAAQSRYFTKTGHIWFFSEAPLEDIMARNRQVVSFIDFKTGELAFSVPMTAFQFKKSLMQTHFNENFVESGKYPKSTFSGTFSKPGAIDPTKEGTYKVQVEGQLTIHGVEKALSTDGILEVRNGKVRGKATFIVAPHDYDITIPLLVREHIAKEVAVHVDMLYEPFTGNTP